MTKATQRLTCASRESLLTLLETLSAAVFVIDDEARIVYANGSALAMPGVTTEEGCGQSFWRCASHLVTPSLYQAFQRTKQTGEPGKVAYLSPTNRQWLSVSLAAIDEGIALVFQEQPEPLPQQHPPLSRNETLYRDLLESFSDGVTIVAPDGLILDINQRPLTEAHLRRESVIGTLFPDLPSWSADPQAQQRLRAAIAQASQGETVRFEATIHPRADLSLDILMTITSHRDATQKIDYLICAGRDITERKRAETDLRMLLDAIPQFVWIARPDGLITYSNQRLIDYLAMTHQQAEGIGWWMTGVHPDDQQCVWNMWQTAIQTDTLYEGEFRLRDGTSGAYRWFLVRGVPQRDAQGTIVHWVGTCTDIEHQKRAEQQLKASEQNWRVLAETVPQLVWIERPDGSIEYANQRNSDYLQASPEQLAHAGWSRFVHVDDAQRTLAAWHHAVATGNSYEIYYRFKHGQTGAYRWFLARAMPVRDDTGQVLKWVGTATDIDDQKRAEEALRQSREELRVVMEMMPQLVWIAQPDGFLEYGNQQALTYLNIPLEQFTGDQWANFVHPEDFPKTWAIWQTAIHTGQSAEVEYRLREGKTGNYRWFLVRGTPFIDAQGQLIKWFGTCTDIDEQKRIEEALRQSQERIRALITSNIIGIVSGEGEEEVLVEANEAFLRMTGYTQEEVQSRTLNRAKITAPEDVPLFQRALQELTVRGQHTPMETELVCKDGSRLPVVMGSVLFQDHPLQVISFVLDNSARKELEQRKDDFLSIASHELRTPLTSLKLQTQLVQKRLEKQGLDAAVVALSGIERPIKQLERLITELLDVSKIQAGRLEYVREPVDLNTLLQEVGETMQQMNPTHTLVVQGAASRVLVGDKDRLGQVFLNLLSNAIKYSPGAETVEIHLSTSTDTAMIQVRDHGLGIPREQLDHIFERFYRVSGPNPTTIPGLGMGLYIVAEIVKRHGGTISVESAVGKGSTFTVILPL
jgi:PAS domain S-box-containing protein